ncbi:tetratricopeptide repeat protein [Undibacterium sp. Ji67W]|uniref:tetratricopeptide repeat protein n=1 Tax=Undibacterium sp. Ji67W TaxID=3413042 RepID=UPI003BF21E16
MGLFDKFAFFKKNNDTATTPVEVVHSQPDLITQGNQAEDSGDLELAIRLYQNAIEEQPELPRAHLNLGNAYLKLKEFDKAIAAYQTALKFNPEYASASFNIGNAYFKSERATESIPFYIDAIKWRPEFVDAYVSYGLALLSLGKFSDAAVQFNEALKRRPGYAEASLHLSNALIFDKKYDQGIEILLKLEKQYPDSIQTHLPVINAYSAKGDLANAINRCRVAARCLTEDANFYYQLGLRSYDFKEYEIAITCFQRALKITKDIPHILNSLGNAYLDSNDTDNAIRYFNEALKMVPESPGIHSNLGLAYQQSSKLELAISFFEKAIKLEPGLAVAHNNLAQCLVIFSRIEEAIQSYYKAFELNPETDIAYTNYLFALCHDPCIGKEELFEKHRRFSEIYEKPVQGLIRPLENSKSTNRILRVGFVSADLRDHAVVSFVEPVFLYLARKANIHLYAYDNNNVQDDVTVRLKGYFREWFSVLPLSNEQLVEKIRKDQIDVLIDLSGHTAHHRLSAFAMRPAPIQISWIGYPGTSGLDAMDYFLGDQNFLPYGEMDKQFTEKIVRLPCATTFKASDKAPPVNELPAKTNGYLTFASFNRPDKLNRGVIALWGKVLRALPNAKLVMAAMRAESGIGTLQAWLNEEGITSDRLTFFPRSTIHTYLSLHHQVDICLDTFPYTGGTTTNNALWMGVPTLTLVGETPAGRQGIANLSQVGLDKQFAAIDTDDFVQKAIYFSEHIDELSSIRASLRKNFSESNFSKPGLVSRSIERAIHYMFERWCADLPPVAFEVDDDKIRLYDADETL